MKKDKDKVIRILAIIVAIMTVGYFGFNMLTDEGRGLKTATAYITTLSETVDTELFIIRDEELFTSDVSGVVVSLVGNGEKVGNGSKIAAVFSNEKDAENYSKALSLEKKLDTYRKIDGQVKLANVDLDKLNAETDTTFNSILDAVYYNDYSSLAENELSFGEQLSRKNVSLGYNVDCSAQISGLESKIKKFKSAAPSSEIASTRAGYYVSRPDGFENILTVADIDTLTEKQLTDALKAEKKESDDKVIGKVVGGFEWYAAGIVPSEKFAKYETGTNVSLMLGDYADETISAKLYKKQTLEDDKCLVVFKCSFMNERLSELRKVSGKIVLKSYSGIKLRKDAVRFDEEGNQGVYIVEGNLIKFNKIKEIYSDDKFVMADSNMTGAGWLALYDEVVVSGKELKNGKVIG